MATQLLVIPTRLHLLASKLKCDCDIQTQINDIASKARTAAEWFKSVISKEGSAVVLQKTLLVTSSHNEINILDMKGALKAATNALTATRKLVVSLQTDIHSSIETCKSRQTQHESELDTILSRISNMWAEIESLEVIISTHEDEATALEFEALKVNKRADDKKRAAKKKRCNVEITNLIGGLAGLALAPFTDGTSMALASAATCMNATEKLSSAEKFEETASRLHNDAERRQKKARELKTQKSKLIKERSSLKAKLRLLQSRTESLTEASNVLQQVTSFLLPTINAIDVLLNAFQDIDTAIEDASLQSNSFQAIRNAFSSQPERNGRCLSPHLNQLKEKWKQLEDVLLQHGAQKTSF